APQCGAATSAARCTRSPRRAAAPHAYRFWGVPRSSVHQLHARPEQVTLLHAVPILAGAGADAADVVLRLGERRDAAEALDVAFPGVVGGEDDALVVEAIKQ